MKEDKEFAQITASRKILFMTKDMEEAQKVNMIERAPRPIEDKVEDVKSPYHSLKRLI